MKQKTHSGAKKRFKLTSKSKIMARKAAARHLLTHKNKRQKKQQRQVHALAKSDVQVVKELLKV